MPIGHQVCESQDLVPCTQCVDSFNRVRISHRLVHPEKKLPETDKLDTLFSFHIVMASRTLQYPQFFSRLLGKISP